MKAMVGFESHRVWAVVWSQCRVIDTMGSKETLMVSVLSNNLGELSTLCSRFGVKRLAVFGSAVRADFDESSSDLDFVVEFRVLEPNAHKDAYFGLLEALANLFSRDIDLIELSAVRNPYVKKRILEQQETLYDAA